MTALRTVANTLVDPPAEGPDLRSRLLAVPVHTWLFLLGLTATLFSGWTYLMGLPISPDRLLLPAALALLVFDGTRPRHRTTAVHWLMLVFVVWIVVDMTLHGMLLHRDAQFSLLDRVIMPFLVFLAAPLMFDTPFRRRLLLVWLSGIGLYLGATALLESFAPALVWPSYITDPYVGAHWGRARGPFLGGDAMGTACGMLGATAVLLAVRSRGHRRWAAGAVVVLGGLGVLLSLTRATWVAAAAGLLVAALLVPALRRRLPLLALAGLALAGIAVAAMPQLVTAMTDRASDPRPVWDRLGSSDAAFALLRDRPLTGIGWRRFNPHGLAWFRQSDAYPTNVVNIEIHNVVLSRVAELGVIAGAIFVAILLLGPGRSLWQRPPAHPTGPRAVEVSDWRVLGATVFTIWFTAGMFGPMSFPFPTIAAFLVCGVAAGPYLLMREDAGGSSRARLPHPPDPAPHSPALRPHRTVPVEGSR